MAVVICKICGKEFKARPSMIEIGRYLRDDEIVHHINGDITDNRPENLEVMTQSEYAKFENVRRDDKTGRYCKKVINQ